MLTVLVVAPIFYHKEDSLIAPLLKKFYIHLIPAAMIVCTSCAIAQASPSVPPVIRSSSIIEASGSASIDDTSNLVFVGGISLLRIHTTWAGRSPEVRADQVQERVNHALSVGPVSPGDITVGTLQGDWVVLFRGHRLFTADAATAKLESTPAKALANEWAASARQILCDLTKPTGVAK